MKSVPILVRLPPGLRQALAAAAAAAQTSQATVVRRALLVHLESSARAEEAAS